MPSKPEFRIRLNGVYVPNLRVEKARDGGLQIAVRDEEFGWFVIDDNSGIHDALPHFKLEYRDETAWALVPVEMKQALVDKGWNRATPSELIGYGTLELSADLQRR